MVLALQRPRGAAAASECERPAHCVVNEQLGRCRPSLRNVPARRARTQPRNDVDRVCPSGACGIFPTRRTRQSPVAEPEHAKAIHGAAPHGTILWPALRIHEKALKEALGNPPVHWFLVSAFWAARP